MLNYIRFVLRSREGLRAYLRFLCAVLGGLFAVHLFLLVILVADDYDDQINLMLYEVIGTFAAGIGCAIVTERLLRISVSAGVSRKSFLRGTVCTLPLFVLITTAAITLVFLVTDGIYRLTGNSLGCVANEIFWLVRYDSVYQPRMAMFGITYVFFLVMFFYAVALLFTGMKNRFSLAAGLITSGVIIGLCMMNIDLIEYGLFYRHEYFSLYLNPAYAAEQQLYYETMPQDHFWHWLLELAAFGLFIYLLAAGIFAMLTRRAPVRGKEQEGDV